MPPTTELHAQVHAACIDVLDRFMAALNAHDADAMDATMHFPHVRLAGGRMAVYPAAGSNPMDLFSRLRDADGWGYSVWRERRIVQFDERKAHVALSYTRFRDDGSVIGVYESLYTITREGDRWGIQMRSSFGP